MLTFTGALQDTVGRTTPGTGFLHLGNPLVPSIWCGHEVFARNLVKIGALAR